MSKEVLFDSEDICKKSIYKHIFKSPEKSWEGHTCKFCGGSLSPAFKKKTLERYPLKFALCFKSNVEISSSEIERREVNCFYSNLKG